MHSGPQTVPLLLQLPDTCLLAVLQCCADDPRTLFSAARAHSRLHQAAVLAASSVTAVLLEPQQQPESVLLYLSKHGQHASSINLSAPLFWKHCGPAFSLRQLPKHLHRLESLRVCGLCVQLQPGHGYQGLLHAVMPLLQLQLQDCALLDMGKGLAAALPLLPRLRHLSITICTATNEDGSQEYECVFPGEVLQGLQQLTYLQLADCGLSDPAGLRHLHGLTRLQDLRLSILGRYDMSASMLSGSQQLTRLEVGGNNPVDGDGEGVLASLEPAVLAGKTMLQHLSVEACYLAGPTGICSDAAGVTELLSQLQQLHQLTHLSVRYSLHDPTSAEDYSALTTSSKLQYLDVSDCTLPSGVWQHMFPTGGRLPHLRVLNKGYVHHPTPPAADHAALEGSRLVSCCPGLQSLNMLRFRYSALLLAPLTGLRGLQDLRLGQAPYGSSEGLEVVCQLTGLRRLELSDPSEDGLLLQLTQLKGLTHLEYFRVGDQCVHFWIDEVGVLLRLVWYLCCRIGAGDVVA